MVFGNSVAGIFGNIVVVIVWLDYLIMWKSGQPLAGLFGNVEEWSTFAKIFGNVL